MSTTTISTPPHRAPLRRAPTSRAVWLGFLVVLASAVMDLLDSTIAQTAAPAIRRDLGGSYTELEWISAAYTLAMSATLLLGSRLGDMFGRRRVLLAGIGGFVARLDAVRGSRPIAGDADRRARAPGRDGGADGPAGLRPDPRAVRRRGPAAGLRRVRPGDGPGARWPARSSAAGSIDLNLLGTGWRAIFLVNVPLGLAAIAAGRRYLPRGRPSAAGARLDAPSVLLAMAGGVAIVYPLIQGREHGWPAWSFALLAGGCGAARRLRAGCRRAAPRQGRAPLVEPSILRRRPYVAGLARRRRLHRRDGRDDDRAQRHVPDRARLLAARPAAWPRWRSRWPRSAARSPPRRCSPGSGARRCTSASR